MTGTGRQETYPAPADRDVPQERRCLRCNTPFWSEWSGERICRRCKATSAWRNAAPARSGSPCRR